MSGHICLSQEMGCMPCRKNEAASICIFLPDSNEKNAFIAGCLSGKGEEERNPEYRNLETAEENRLELFPAEMRIRREDHSLNLSNWDGIRFTTSRRIRMIAEGNIVFAGKNSFLVCRCGGIIHILYDGQDMKRHLFYLYPNIINILKSAEAYFYEKYHEYKTDGRVKFSMMDGYNFVRFILIALKEESQYEEFLGVKYKDIELFGAFGVEMDILIRPRSVMNKDENIKTAIADDPSVTNITAEASAITSDFGKNLVKAVGKAAGYIFDLKDIAGIAKNLSYTSAADYVGEVQSSFSLGTHDIIYRRKYNI